MKKYIWSCIMVIIAFWMGFYISSTVPRCEDQAPHLERAHTQLEACRVHLDEVGIVLNDADCLLEECQQLLEAHQAAGETCEIYNKVVENERLKNDWTH